MCSTLRFHFIRIEFRLGIDGDFRLDGLTKGDHWRLTGKSGTNDEKMIGVR